ncbi:MAG: CPBP family intramembrane glutamic endopeptidase [Solirubrobacteraceae bacterium]
MVALLLGTGAAWAIVGVLRLLGADVPHGVGGLIVELALLCPLVPLYRSGALRAVDLGLRRVPAARSVGFALLGLYAYGWSSRLWSSAVHPPPIHSPFAGIANQSTLVIALTGLLAVAGAPIVEEVFFRGFLYRSLRNRMGILPGCLIVGVLFGIGHTQYPLLVRPELAGFGVIACLMYERTGSLLPGIAMHSFIDSSGFEYGLTGRVNIVFDAFALLALAMLLVGFFKTIAKPHKPATLPNVSGLQRLRGRGAEAPADAGG